jgi:hypothetical protein
MSNEKLTMKKYLTTNHYYKYTALSGRIDYARIPQPNAMRWAIIGMAFSHYY